MILSVMLLALAHTVIIGVVAENNLNEITMLPTTNTSNLLLLLGNLGPAFESCFKANSIDGDAILNSPRELVEEACPEIFALQWNRLWRRLESSLRPLKMTESFDQKERGSRRQLSSVIAELEGYSGIDMKNNNSIIKFGLDQAIYRSEEGIVVRAPSLRVDGGIWLQDMSILDNLTSHEQRIADLESQLIEAQEKLQAIEDVSLVNECELLFQGRACMSSTDDLHDDSAFISGYDGLIHGAMVVYHSGSVSCNGNAGTNWGCNSDDTAIGAWIIDDGSSSSYTKIYPADGTYELHGSSGSWYESDDDRGWWPNAAYLYFDGELEVTAGEEFHLQFGEALLDSTTSDNDGTTCADVYWKVGDCAVQTSGGTSDIAND
jgi:hypothetical protein